MSNTFRGGEIYGIQISTVFDENDTIRCAGCGEPIAGQSLEQITDLVMTLD